MRSITSELRAVRARRASTGEHDFHDAGGRTPIAPAPSFALLARAGAPWYSRYRTLLTWGAAVGAALVVFLIVVDVFMSGHNPPPAAAVVLPAPAPPPVRPRVTPIDAETVLLSVSVSPADAQVIVDDEPMPSNPFVTRVPRGVATHRIRATAPGYQTRERVVSFADNVMLDLSLPPAPVRHASAHEESARRHEPPPRHAPRAPSPPPAAPPPVARPEGVLPPPAAATAEPERPRRRRIDVNNPYKEEP